MQRSNGLLGLVGIILLLFAGATAAAGQNVTVAVCDTGVDGTHSGPLNTWVICIR